MCFASRIREQNRKCSALATQICWLGQGKPRTYAFPLVGFISKLQLYSHTNISCLVASWTEVFRIWYTLNVICDVKHDRLMWNQLAPIAGSAASGSKPSSSDSENGIHIKLVMFYPSRTCLEERSSKMQSWHNVAGVVRTWKAQAVLHQFFSSVPLREKLRSQNSSDQFLNRSGTLSLKLRSQAYIIMAWGWALTVKHKLR